MINSNRLNDDQLDIIVKNNKYKIIQVNNDKILIVNNENYFYPNEICFANLGSRSYKSKEFYNFLFLKNNPPLKINIDIIKKFLKNVLSSRVFKELFCLLTGKQNYDEIFNLKMIDFIIKNIKFLPLNFSYVSGFFDKLSLTTYISTMKKVIYCYSDESVPEKIYAILENAIIIQIIFHEFWHMISAVICYTDNLSTFINTPRKKNLKIHEGGYYVEIALFGKIIKKLTLEECLYILNVNNYQKSLEDYRIGFESLKRNDLEINGPFENFNLNINNKGEHYGKKFSISTKPSDYSILKDIEANFSFLIDVKGRDFTQEDLLYYTH